MKQASAAHIGAEPDSRRQGVSKIVIAYPFGVLAIALAINLLCFEISGFEASIPGQLSLSAFALAAIVFCLNHSWLMTATELTRVRYHMYATPEEWKANGTSIDDISQACDSGAGTNSQCSSKQQRKYALLSGVEPTISV